MSIITSFFGGMPGLLLSLATVLFAFYRPGLANFSLALIVSALVSRLVHRAALPAGQPAGRFRPMFAAAGYTAVAAGLYLSRFPMPFGGSFRPYCLLAILFLFMSILGVHWVNRRRHEASLSGFTAKGDQWLAEESHVAEVERGFICLGITGTMWTMVLASWGSSMISTPSLATGDFCITFLQLVLLLSLYLLPWLSFAWWVGEKSVRRGIYTGVGLTVSVAPVAYYGYFHSMSGNDWWLYFLTPGGHLAGLTIFLVLTFLVWWIRPSASTTGRGLLGGFYASALPAMLILPGLLVMFWWHPGMRQGIANRVSMQEMYNILYDASSHIAFLGTVPLIIVLLFCTLGGLRSTGKNEPSDASQPESADSVAAAGSQTFTVLLGTLISLFVIAAHVNPLFSQAALSGAHRQAPELLVSWAVYLPIFVSCTIIFAGLWFNGAAIAGYSRLPHPRLAGAVLLMLHAVVIWGFDPRQAIPAGFLLTLSLLLLLLKLFGKPIPEVRRSLLDYQRFIIWSCFLGMPIIFLTNLALHTLVFEVNQSILLLPYFSDPAKLALVPSLASFCPPALFWSSHLVMTAAFGLLILLGMPFLCLPLYLYPIFKDRKAVDGV